MSAWGPARLANLVESVALAVGIPEPALRVVQDPAPNALVTGRDQRRATLVVTSGLLDRLDLLALEAVVAQQLSLIRDGITHRRDVAVAVLGTSGQLVPPLQRIAARAAAVERGADVASVSVTRYPPGLLGALEAVAAGPEVSASPALSPLWFVPPASAGDLALRVGTMQELV
jgi:heat shock protein HtpX